MFRKIYDSLSMPVHLELLIHDDYVCLKTWKVISEDDFNMVTYPVDMSDNIMSEKSLTYQSGDNAIVEYMEVPPDVSGIYHNRLPAGTLFGLTKEGTEFLPNIPANIRDNYTEKLKGKYFRNISYAWIDPTDPSISSREKANAACWVMGVNQYHNASNPFNSFANTYATKAHPLRAIRQYAASPASLFIYQAFEDDKFTDCSMTFKYNRGCGFSTNILDGWETNDDNNFNYVGQMSEAYPQFTVTSGGGDIDADATDTVDFKMVDNSGATMSRDCVIYLENTGGYLPKKRVNLKDGVGSFKVTALGLEADDTFKVKIGFQNYTGIEEVTYKVV